MTSEPTFGRDPNTIVYTLRTGETKPRLCNLRLRFRRGGNYRHRRYSQLEMGATKMEDISRKPVELNASELDLVAGGRSNGGINVVLGNNDSNITIVIVVEDNSNGSGNGGGRLHC